MSISVEVTEHSRVNKSTHKTTKYHLVTAIIGGVILQAEALSKDAAEQAAIKVREELGL